MQSSAPSLAAAPLFPAVAWFHLHSHWFGVSLESSALKGSCEKTSLDNIQRVICKYVQP